MLFLALPQLTRDLGASAVEQLWISDVYGFVLAGFVITMGTLGDRIGRRRLLFLGGSVFALTSVVAAYSVGPGMLIGARAVLGIAGATLMPSTLALITNMFDEACFASAMVVVVPLLSTLAVPVVFVLAGFVGAGGHTRDRGGTSRRCRPCQDVRADGPIRSPCRPCRRSGRRRRPEQRSSPACRR